VGIVVLDSGVVVHEESNLLNPDEQPAPLGNNQAEMSGLERALQIASVIKTKYPNKTIEIRTDSKNVAMMYNGEYKAHKLKLQFERCEKLRIPRVAVVHITEKDPRHCSRVDELAGLATGKY